MGASSSTATENNTSSEVENLVASTGALPFLQSSFQYLLDQPQSNSIPLHSLQLCFSVTSYNKESISQGIKIPDSFLSLLEQLGPCIVDLFFLPDKQGGLSWIEFLKGYLKCCGRMSSSDSFNTLLRLYVAAMKKLGLPSNLEFESNDSDCKVDGTVLPVDVYMLLLMCWTMSYNVKVKDVLCFPDVSHLVLSALLSCVEEEEEVKDVNVYDCDFSSLEVEIPIGKLQTWVLRTVPFVADCFSQFVRARLMNTTPSEDKSEAASASSVNTSSKSASASPLLTCGRAWGISLTRRGAICAEILKTCFPCDDSGLDENLLYRSRLHGKGLNRFWSNVEGYHGPLLILISATSGDSNDHNTNLDKWIIGVLTHEGFENKDTFYGNSGNLYAISPVFSVFPPSGKEKNFIYSHLHNKAKYEAHPKPVGIAFGGTMGNERIFVDEDFARVIVRHHACDKTYQHGSLFPSQGYLPVEAHILEVEVWGLGGKAAREVQMSYKKREQLFIDQRRQIDLKNFAWEDSPEKMMMDMMSDPNKNQREER
ncbi:hypothetical protein ACFE04_005372 [Oxalis oulophora]